jgi:hypothetical protein
VRHFSNDLKRFDAGKSNPGAQRHVVEGQAHDASAKALAPVLVKFFGAP